MQAKKGQNQNLVFCNSLYTVQGNFLEATQ